MGLELVLDERAAVGKAALADGAVEGQRGGGAELAVVGKIMATRNHGATLAGGDKPFDWERNGILSDEKVKYYDKSDCECLTSTPCAVNEWRASAA